VSLRLHARRPLVAALLTAAMVQGACAAEAAADSAVDSTAEAAGATPADAPPPSRRDPFEPFNRKVYAFNEVVDNAALRPLAEGYRRAVPELARSGVDNFFGNLADAWSAVNKLLQGKVVQAAQMSLRVATNSVFGLGGLLDPATEFGLERQPEDFGQTLGTWGLPAGPYLVLPVLGPSTVRDTAALPLDRGLASPSLYLGGSTNAQLGVTGVQLVAARAGLLSASRLLGDVALDKYSFLRDAYLARRRSQLYDGNPPDDE
jgi:phospholipid-binding lipoprotein MlaA